MFTRVIKILIIILFLYGCNQKDENYDLVINISQNKLHKLFYGNDYYKINGFKFSHNNKNYSITKPGEFLIIESDVNEFNGFNKILLININNKIKLNLHNYSFIESKKINIKFNSYVEKKFEYLPFFDDEFLEKIKNRNTVVYFSSDGNDLSVKYIEEGFPNLLNKKKEINLYNETLNNLEEFSKNGLHPNSIDDITYVYNSLEDKYSLFPDYSNFQTKKKFKFKFNTSNKPRPGKRKKLEIVKDTLISENLILKDYQLIIKRGIKIYLTKKASIYFFNSHIKYKGPENSKVNFISKGINSLYFNNCNNMEISNTTFFGFSNLKDKFILPSAITFFSSNVTIKKCVFESNRSGDDFLNFFNSRFIVSNSLFLNSKADAIDSDFSKGEVINCKFINIGNDAIDLSGSSVTLNSNLFNNVGDKILSIGENSESTISENTFLNSELAVVVKDGANVTLKNNIYKNNKIDIVAFQKKSFYGHPTINFFENGKAIKNMIEKNACLNNFNQVVNYKKNIKNILYGEYYGKASK